MLLVALLALCVFLTILGSYALTELFSSDRDREASSPHAHVRVIPGVYDQDLDP